MAWPTTSDPRDKFVTVRFTQTESDDIDRFVGDAPGAVYKDRSSLLRAATDREVARLKRLARKQQPQQQTQQEALDE